MGFLSAILSAIGSFVAPLFRVLVQEGKKAREVKQAGYDEELKQDVKQSIEDKLNEDKS